MGSSGSKPGKWSIFFSCKLLFDYHSSESTRLIIDDRKICLVTRKD